MTVISEIEKLIKTKHIFRFKEELFFKIKYRSKNAFLHKETQFQKNHFSTMKFHLQDGGNRFILKNLIYQRPKYVDRIKSF